MRAEKPAHRRRQEGETEHRRTSPGGVNRCGQSGRVSGENFNSDGEIVMIPQVEVETKVEKI